MADLISSIPGLSGLSFADPIALVFGLILSTIIGGIVILIIVGIFAKKFSESIKPLNAFILAFVVSLINIFGVIGILGSFLAAVPLGGIVVLVLPILVWFVLLKVFFGEMELLHLLILSVVCYLVSIYLIPMLTGMVRGLLPL